MVEWECDISGMTFRGKHWGNGEGLPVIALHGWLDNAASFDYLGPLLNKVDLLAIDLAGQGLSDHRRHAGAYNIWLDITEIIAIANAMGWEKFGLLGHSRGAMIATLIASTFPKRVSHLALIESFTPQFIEPHEAPGQLEAAVTALIQLTGRERSEFKSFDDAVKARERGFVPLSHEDAMTLAKRGVTKERDKFYWSNDMLLNAPSEVKFTEEQIQAFVDRLEIPISLVLAENGIVYDFPKMKEFIDDTPNVEVHRFPGEHHLHMSLQSKNIALVFNDYFSN